MADDKTYLALADEHQWKSFNDLSQIGITAGSETINDIVVALPVGSDLSYAIRASQHNHDAYPYPTGTITIKKYSDSACDIEHVCSANNEYRGTWRMYAVGSANTFILSDWIQVYDAVNPPEKISRESITPFTVDNAEEGSTQSFINFSTGGSVNGAIGFYGLLPYIMDDEGNLLGKIYHAGDKPTASDVGALAEYHFDFSFYTTVLEAATAHDGSYTFFAVSGDTQTLWIAEDSPAQNREFQYLVLTDHTARRTVLAISFDYCNIFVRRIFDGAWSTDWRDIGGDFKSDGSVPMTNNLLIAKNGTPSIFLKDTSRNRTSEIWTAHDNFLVLSTYPSDDFGNNNVQLWIAPETRVLHEMLMLYVKKQGAEATYRVYGEHNKPSGTYSGNNGSQTIDTGGLGDVILVQLTGSGGGFALVTKSGAIGKLNSNNSVFALADTEAKFIGGVLTLNSSNYGVNRSGYGYNWQVL